MGARRVTLEQFLAEWLEVSVKPNRRWRTYAVHETHVRVHIVPHLGSLPLKELTPYRVQRLIALKLGEGLKPGTVGKPWPISLKICVSRGTTNVIRKMSTPVPTISMSVG